MLCIIPVISYVSNEQKIKKAQTLKVMPILNIDFLDHLEERGK
jgi:hypothetical protein